MNDVKKTQVQAYQGCPLSGLWQKLVEITPRQKVSDEIIHQLTVVLDFLTIKQIFDFFNRFVLNSLTKAVCNYVAVYLILLDASYIKYNDFM